VLSKANCYTCCLRTTLQYPLLDPEAHRLPAASPTFSRLCPEDLAALSPEDARSFSGEPLTWWREACGRWRLDREHQGEVGWLGLPVRTRPRYWRTATAKSERKNPAA
jgi:hypothetical protein